MGYRLIEKGSYEIIRADDSQVVGPSELAGVVESGTVLEMSIVLRQSAAHQKQCPRCGYGNLTVAMDNVWIEWQVLKNVYSY